MKSLVVRVLFIGVSLLAVACGSDDSSSASAGAGNTAGNAGAAGSGGGAGAAGASGAAGIGGEGGAGASGGTGGQAGGGTAGSSGTGGGCGDTSSDPANCGSCGHDCLGGACESGLCQPVVLREDIYGSDFLVSDDTLYYALAHNDDPRQMKKGPLTPMATDSTLGVASDFSGDLSHAGDNLFWLITGGDYPDYTSQVAFMSKQGGTITTMDDDVDGYIASATEVYVLVSGELYARPLSGGSLVSLTSSTSDWAYYQSNKLFGDGDHLYVSKTGGSGQGRVLFRIPTDGSAGSIAVDLPGWVIDLTFNDASMVGVAWAGGAYAQCSSSPSSTLWTAPKTGGSPTTVVTHGSLISRVVADETYIYFTDECEDTLWRVPVAGGTPEMVFDDVSPEVKMAQDETALYFKSGTDILRLAK